MGNYVPLGGSSSPVAYCAYHKSTLSVHQMERKKCLQKQCCRLCKICDHPYWQKKEPEEKPYLLQKEKLREIAEQPSETSRNNIQMLCDSSETQGRLHIICDIIDLKRELTSECDGSILCFLSGLGLLPVPEESETKEYYLLTVNLDGLKVAGISKRGAYAAENAAKCLLNNLCELRDNVGETVCHPGTATETPDREKIAKCIMAHNGTKLSKSIDTMLQLYACGIIARPQITESDGIEIMIPGIGVRCAEDQKHLRNAVSALLRDVVREWVVTPSREDSAEQTEEETNEEGDC